MPTPNPHLTLNNGVEMPALGLGVYQCGPEETVDAVRTALDEGYRMIDTAAAYQNEEQVGRALRESDVDRSEVFVTTKLWISDYGSDEALRAYDRSLDRFGIATQAWSPIGGVMRYWDDAPEASMDPLRDPVIVEIAETHEKTAAQVMLRWHLKHGHSAIPKSVHTARIAENFDVFDFTLTDDEVAAIDALDTGTRGGPDPETIDTETYG